MSLDPRTEELLAGYPDQLTDDELAELRAQAEGEPEVQRLMDAIHDVERRLAGEPLASPELSSEGQRRLDAIVEDTRAWTHGGATPTAQQDNVVSLSAARRRRWGGAVVALAAAALLAIGLLSSERAPVDTAVTSAEDFRFKGADGQPVSGSLFVMGEQRVSDGQQRPVDASVTFRAVVPLALSLALVEVGPGGGAHVLHPRPGQRWQVPAGSHLLQGGGGAAYRPAGPGEARYVLVGSAGSLQVPAGPVDLDAWVASQPGAAVLDSLSIRWTARATP